MRQLPAGEKLQGQRVLPVKAKICELKAKKIIAAAAKIRTKIFLKFIVFFIELLL